MQLLLGFLLVLGVLREAGAASCITAPTNGVGLCNPCGGSCDSANGCVCPNLDQCIPDDGCPMNSSSCCPTGLYWHMDLNCCSTELACAPACMEDEVCTNVSGQAACLCNQTQYQQTTINDIQANVTCQSSVMIISVKKCAMDALRYDPSSLRLTNSTCSATYADVVNNRRVYVMQALPLSQYCGNSMTKTDVNVTYSNVLYMSPYSSGLILAGPLNLSFSCTYDLNMLTSLATVLRPVLNSVNLTIPGQTGTAVVTMAAYLNDQYNVPVVETSQLTVGMPLYIGLLAQFVDAERFVLRIVRCFATPIRDSNSPNKVDLIVGGCPANQNIAVRVESNGISLEGRFRMSTFLFQDLTDVYVFCDVRFCDKTAETCTGCMTGRSAVSTSRVEVGPLTLQDTTSSGSHPAVPCTLLVTALLTLLNFRLM